MASPCTAIGGNTPVLTPNNDPVPTSNGQCDLGPLMECRYERNSRMSWRVVVINKIVSVANVLASNSIIPSGLTISAAYLLHVGVVQFRWPIIYSRQKELANEQRCFHAEAVRIWPFTGTCPHGGCHWDRALEVTYQLPAAQCGHN